jgi:hypothetical protein
MGGLVVFLVSVFALTLVVVCIRLFWLSWAVSVFTGKRKEVLGWLVLCSAVLVMYMTIMRLLLS